MAKFYAAPDTVPVSEDELYARLGFTKIRDGLWAGPYQPMSMKLLHLIKEEE